MASSPKSYFEIAHHRLELRVDHLDVGVVERHQRRGYAAALQRLGPGVVAEQRVQGDGWTPRPASSGDPRALDTASAPCARRSIRGPPPAGRRACPAPGARSSGSERSDAGKLEPHAIRDAPNSDTSRPKNVSGVALSRRRAHEVAFRDLDVDAGKPGEPPETVGRRVRRPVVLDRTRQVIEDDAQAGKALAARSPAAGCRPPSSAGRPGGRASSALRHAGNERGSSSQPAWPGMVLPVVNSRKPVSPRPIQCAIVSQRIGREDVAGEDTGEPLGIGLDGVGDVGVVVSIARRRLDQRGFPRSRPGPAPRSAARRSRAAPATRRIDGRQAAPADTAAYRPR